MLLKTLNFNRFQCGFAPGNIPNFCTVFEDVRLIIIFLTVLRVSRSFSNSPPSDVQLPSDEPISGKQVKPERKSVVPSNSRFIYPEFLPDPKIEWRNSLREKLERMDMIQRRKHIDIPEFYVGRY